MKGKFSFILCLIIILSVFLVSCGKDESQSVSSEPQSPAIVRPVSNFTPVEFTDSIEIDLDLDGQNDSINLMQHLYSEMSEDTWAITVNGQNFNYEYFSMVRKAFIMDYDDSDGYREIVVLAITDNDYRTTDVFRLVNGVLTHTSVAGELIVTNNNELTISGRIDLLGTWSCTSQYVISDEFVFERASEITFIDTEYVYCQLKTKAVIYDADEKTTIPAGTILTPVKTDGASWITLSDENGKVYTIPFVCEIPDDYYNITINGYAPSDLFEELPYAG